MYISGIFAGLLLAAIAAANSAEDFRIEVVRLPATSAIVRDMKGDYSQHAAAARAMYATLGPACFDRTAAFGEYPDDPDVVGPDQVKWRLGFLIPDVSALAACRANAHGLYRTMRYQAVQAATLRTTLGASRAAGLAMLKWLPGSGYVQVAPTRMVFLDRRGAPDSPVRIEVPVRERTWAVPASGKMRASR